jgi:hypothetical protein
MPFRRSASGTSVAAGGAVLRRMTIYGILVLSLLCAPRAVKAQQPAEPQPSQQDASPDAAPPPSEAPSSLTNSRIFGVMPNYATVEDAAAIQPLAANQKFHLAALYAFDPFVYPFVGAIAAVGRGEGEHRYIERYGLAFADNTLSSFLTVAVVPSAFHQDPRYFRLGKGGAWRRAGYTMTRSVAARSDAGKTMFNVSEIGGNLLVAGISNMYYPASDRSIANTLTRWGMQVMWDTLSNELKEFWPDIRRKIKRT